MSTTASRTRKASTTTEESALADAKALHAQRVEEQERAEREAENLRDRLSAGDESVTAEELSRADREVERTALLAKAARRQVQTAERRQSFTPDLAEMLAPTLSEALGVPVHVCEKLPSELPDSDSLPVAYVHQPKASKADVHDGTVAGAVEVAFYRTKLHREARTDGIEAKLAQAQTFARVDSIGEYVESGAVVSDRLRIDVRSGFLAEPVVGSVPSWRVSRFAQTVAAEAAQDRFISRAEAGVRMGHNGDASATLASIRGYVDSQRLVNVQEASGKRTAEVEVTFTIAAVGPRRGEWSGEALTSQAREAVERQAGRAAAGLGRVESATVVSIGAEARLARQVVARFTFSSRIEG
ncbi:hypothetical protein [Angustibacter sp. Root456]|uniref:hypothetical protein n=1 Tax=Angustibacter sp. Root456 TaxID=1736539 RepID=UPI0006FF26C0|nr:hypothetical protein [Angustibacter sp. Root456]KQX66451.1 hypothetical protein ASD06_03395 [Angustibacter sp. Root456]